MKLPPQIPFGFQCDELHYILTDFFGSLNIHILQWNVKNLYPKSCFHELIVTERIILRIALHQYKVLDETPWLTMEYPVNIRNIVKDKRNHMVTQVLNPKAILSPP